MQYSKLVEIYEKLEATPKRLEKTFIISKFLKNIKEDDLESTILLLQGKIFPEWDERKIGVASRLVLKAINKATGIDVNNIEKEWAKIGDLGKVSELLVKGKKQATLFSSSLSVKKVLDNLRKLSQLEGQGSVDKKIGLIAELLTSSKPLEAKYIIRTLLEELRVGTATGTLRDSLVWAYFPKAKVVYNEKEKSIEVEDRENYNKYTNLVQEAYNVSNDLSLVAKMARSGKIKDIHLKVGIPIKVMLGPKEADAKSALERTGIPAQAEYKYDGFRIQAHKDKDKITLFTRNLENVTLQFPEVVKCIRSNVKGDNFILDSEGVGFSSKTKKYLPFQSISQRIKRKYNIEKMSEDFPVELNVFDCIYYNGKSMIKEPFKKRRALIEKIVKQLPKKIVISTGKIVKNEAEVNKFYKQALDLGNEGLMLKKLDAPYKPGARVGYMVKMKEAEEPLDLVIVEAEWGEGKRAKWFSSFTLACLDENDNFVEIGKVGTGIKEIATENAEDVTFGQLTNLLKPLVINQKGKIAKVKPKVVVEIMYDELQISQTYSSGYALRFPRVIRLRQDRNPDNISTLKLVEQFYNKQKK